MHLLHQGWATAIPFFAGCPNNSAKMFPLIQNAAARVLTSTAKRDHNSKFLTYNGLKIRALTYLENASVSCQCTRALRFQSSHITHGVEIELDGEDQE